MSSPTLSLPPALTQMVSALQTLEMHLQPLLNFPRLGATPFFCRHQYAVTALPRDFSELERALGFTPAHRRLDFTTHNYREPRGPYDGLTLYIRAPLLLTLDWTIPPFCDEQADGTATLTVDWALGSASTFTTLKTLIVRDVARLALDRLLYPFTRQCSASGTTRAHGTTPGAVPPTVLGEALGQALRTLTLSPKSLQQVLTTLSTTAQLPR